MGKQQITILLIGAALALLVFLFPDWQAIHPSDPTLTEFVGWHWRWSTQPPPPAGFAMHTEPGDIWVWIVGMIAVATATLLWVER